MPLTPLAGPLGKKRAAHLLRRACIGASTAEIDAFANISAEEAVTQLFRTDLPDPPLPIDPATGTEWISEVTDANSEEFQLGQYLNRWMIGQMLAVDVPADQRLAYTLRERIVTFLHTLFTTKRSVVNNSRAIYFQNALFRQFAFDQQDVIIPSEEEEVPDTIYRRDLKKLSEKVSVDNAMLVFLDGRLNVRGNPNENYARELLELFTIGRGLEGAIPEPAFDGDYFTFTEQDVQEGAKVLSGFNIDRTFSNIDQETGLPRGVVKGTNFATQHDNSTKVFSDRMGAGSISPDPTLLINSNAVEASVLDEITQFIDLIYAQAETSRHICRKLYRYFVYHQIDEDLQNTLIQDLTDIFEANQCKIQPVLEALFTSVEFYEGADGRTDDKFGALIKSPIDLTLGFIKNFDITIPSYETDLNGFYEFMGDLTGRINVMGLDYYEPFEVAGYPAYHQFPIYNRSWITTNYLTFRYQFVAQRFTVDDAMTGQVNVYDFVRNNIPESEASDTESLVIALAEYFLPMSEELSFDAEASELTAKRLNFFKEKLLFDGNPDPEAYWTERWTLGIDREDVSRQLNDLLNAMLQSPEYQLM
ncbi:MAG: DUF1800 family protein [Cytophagales bacterium]|nr:DUF1800 family protein [Cytophagales bacterium]